MNDLFVCVCAHIWFDCNSKKQKPPIHKNVETVKMFCECIDGPLVYKSIYRQLNAMHSIHFLT